MPPTIRPCGEWGLGVQVFLALAAIAMVAGLILGARLLMGKEVSAWWVRWELTTQMLASSLASGAAITWLGVVGARQPQYDAPAMHAVLVITTIAATAWWVWEQRQPEPRTLWVSPPNPPASSRDAHSPGTGHQFTAGRGVIDVPDRLRRWTSTLSLTPRHVLFGGIVLVVIGMLLLVTPVTPAGSSRECGSVLFGLQRGYFGTGTCGEALRLRAWVALPMVAAGVITSAGALILPSRSDRE